MKKSKTEIALIWDAIHGILVRNRNTDTMLEVNSTANKLNSHDVIEMRTRTTCLESEVVDLMRCDAAKDSQIEDLNAEVINLVRSDAVKDDQIYDHERRLKKQEEINGRLSTGIGNLSTTHRDLSIKLGDTATTVASLVADKDALISHNKCLSQRENELQAQVDELQIKVNDQAEALERLLTGMESVAKALTSLDGWMTNVETLLSALRKST